jgi:hypothetical protein
MSNSTASDARARIAAATASVLDYETILRSQGVRQLTPSHANARQSAPPIPAAQNEPTVTAPRADARQATPTRADAPHSNADCKTNPPPRRRPPRPLTPNQFRAATLLVAGHSTTDVAAVLQVDRHTLARWKRHPLFVQELRALSRQRS